MDHLLNIVKEFKNLEKQFNLKHLYRKELDKPCFAHDVAYPDSKDLTKRTILDMILKDRAYEIARNWKYVAYQRALASMVDRFSDKKTGLGVSVNEQPAEELHKPVIKKIKRRKVCARFKDNVWAAVLAEMGSLSSKNKNVKYLLCAINFFTKYALVKYLKDKKGKTVLDAFIKTVNEFNRKSNKLWFGQGREFHNKLMQEWLDNNNTLIYTTLNEGKPVMTEKFIKTLKAKIYKKMTSNESKSYLSYLNKLVD